MRIQIILLMFDDEALSMLKIDITGGQEDKGDN